MKKKRLKKDAGTIFSPVMYLAVLIFAVQLILLFLGYRRMAWLSDTVTNSLTDALLGAAVLNEEELYRFGRTDELEILEPREKYEIFRSLLAEGMGLDADMHSGEKSIPFVKGRVDIKDFRVYSVCGRDVTIYDFDTTGSFATSLVQDGAGVMTTEHGEVIEKTSLIASIGFTVDFMGIPLPVSKYHMVDITR